MKNLKSIATFILLAGMLTLGTGMSNCAIGAALVTSTLILERPTFYYGTTGGAYVRPIGSGPAGFQGQPGGGPAGFQSQPSGAPPGFSGSGNDMKILLNDKEVSHDEIVAIAKSKYDFDQAATDKIIAALAAASEGDNMTAAKSLGLTRAMADEIKTGSISDDTADQIASAVGSSKESMRKYVHDINDAAKEQNMPTSAFDLGNCDHCG